MTISTKTHIANVISIKIMATRWFFFSFNVQHFFWFGAADADLLIFPTSVTIFMMRLTEYRGSLIQCVQRKKCIAYMLQQQWSGSSWRCRPSCRRCRRWVLPDRHTAPPTPSPGGPCSSGDPPCTTEGEEREEEVRKQSGSDNKGLQQFHNQHLLVRVGI